MGGCVVSQPELHSYRSERPVARCDIPADGGRGVPAAPASQGRDGASRTAGRPDAIRDTALLAIEGERDDISGIGQTKAALDIATKLPQAKKQYFLARDVGHYGIFNGRKWREQIAPVLTKFVAAND